MNCPLLEIGQLSFKEKLDWIKELDYDKMEAIGHHAYCTE